MRKIIAVALSTIIQIYMFPFVTLVRGIEIAKWDFPNHNGDSDQRASDRENVPYSPVHYPSADFDPILEPGMIIILESFDPSSKQVLARMTVPILSDERVSIPGLGVLEIVGKKLSVAANAICKFTNQNFQVGLMMGNVQSVQVLGKVQKPGNYPGYMKLSYLLAEAMDRAVGSNFKVHFYNGANRETSVYRYEDVVRGKNNPLVPPGSILYFPPSASAIWGEMTEKQVNLAYLIVITLGALGVTAIVRN